MTARKRQASIITHSASFVLAALILLSAFAQLIFDDGLYIGLLEGNNVVLDDRDARARNVIGYLKGDEELRYFNEKEQAHMADVRSLVRNGFIMFYAMVGLFLALVILDIKNIARVFMYGSVAAIGLMAMCVLLAPAFGYIFIKFHEVFFDNDLWMLNPETDKLIVLFPEGFFIGFVASVLIRALLISIGLLALGFAMHRLGFHLKSGPDR
jgi:integral membrane protein (TIGR01906 family)